MTIALTANLPLEPLPATAREQLRLALDQGEAYQHALDTLLAKVADDGKEQRAQDYIVTYALEAPAGAYEFSDDEWHWHKPLNENIYLHVSVRDAQDQRFIPGLSVYATFSDSVGAIVGIRHQPFVWHPWLFHYGSNWQIPEKGIYTLKIRIEVPGFHRRDQNLGRRYLEPVEVEFRHIKIDLIYPYQ